MVRLFCLRVVTPKVSSLAIVPSMNNQFLGTASRRTPMRFVNSMAHASTLISTSKPRTGTCHSSMTSGLTITTGYPERFPVSAYLFLYLGAVFWNTTRTGTLKSNTSVKPVSVLDQTTYLSAPCMNHRKRSASNYRKDYTAC